MKRASNMGIARKEMKVAALNKHAENACHENAGSVVRPRSTQRHHREK